MLTCDECSAESEVDEREPGWRAYILRESVSDDASARVILYCPECAVPRAAALDASAEP